MPTMTPACRDIRRSILCASRASGHGHIPTSFSVVEMLYAVYATMRHDPQRPDWPERDLFVLSKGHAALGLYAVLAHHGYFDVAELRTFGAFRSRLGCHPDRFKVPGAEVSTGSLGHGIGLAAGMALAMQLRGSPRRLFTLVGDGEANEGTVWEALMVASDQRLRGLTVLFDCNGSQVRSLQIPNLAERVAAFGCDVVEVDGHDVDALRVAMTSPADTVRAVVARTTKGWGCATLADNMLEWHRKSPDDAQLARFLEELDAA